MLMKKKIVLISVTVLVVLLVALGIFKIVNKGKNQENGKPSNGTAQVGTDDIYINGDSETGVEVDFETGSVIGEVGNKNTSSGNETVGEENMPNNASSDKTDSTGNSSDSQNSTSTDSTDDSEQTSSDPNKQNMEGWTPYHG